MFKKFLSKKQEINYEKERFINKDFMLDSKKQFELAMSFVNSNMSISNNYTKQDQLNIINYTLDIVKRDLQYSLLSEVIYKQDQRGKDLWDFANVLLGFIDKKGQKTVDLSKDIILSTPYKKESMQNAIKNIGKNDFKNYECNHNGYYLENLDLCVVNNGFHTISSGIGFKKGNIKCDFFDDIRLLQNVYSDGENWYKKGGIKIKEVIDFRLALIIEITKMKLSLEKQIGKE